VIYHTHSISSSAVTYHTHSINSSEITYQKHSINSSAVTYHTHSISSSAVTYHTHSISSSAVTYHTIQSVQVQLLTTHIQSVQVQLLTIHIQSVQVQLLTIHIQSCCMACFASTIFCHTFVLAPVVRLYRRHVHVTYNITKHRHVLANHQPTQKAEEYCRNLWCMQHLSQFLRQIPALPQPPRQQGRYVLRHGRQKDLKALNFKILLDPREWSQSWPH
jgi:hypothetical protein